MIDRIMFKVNGRDRAVIWVYDSRLAYFSGTKLYVYLREKQHSWESRWADETLALTVQGSQQIRMSAELA